MFAKTSDSAGRTLTFTYFPGGASQKVFRYNYDLGGNITSLQDVTNNKTVVQCSGFTALGQPGTATFPKPNNISVQTTYTHNSATSRTRKLVAEKIQSGSSVATYQKLIYDQFDGKGNLIRLNDVQNNLVHDYTYDSLDRLMTASGTGTTPYSQSYTYDRIGNITFKSDVGAYSYTYGNKPHAVRSAGNITFQYDNNGRMMQRAVTGGTKLDMEWNADNLPTLIKKNNAATIS